MIVNFMHFLPCFTCLALALIHLFSRRERRNARFALLTALFAIYFFADASYYTLDVSPGMWAALDIVSQFVSLWVIPASVSFLILECGDDLPRHKYFWRYVPGVVLGIDSIILYLSCGMGRIYAFIDVVKSNNSMLPLHTETDLALFYCNNIVGSRVVFLIQTILALTVLTFMLLRKRKVSGTCDRRDLVICSLMMLSFVFSSARAVLGRFYMLDNQAISALISACIGVLFIALGVVLSNGWKDSSIDEPAFPLRSVDPPDGLKAKFLAYMENEKPYLDPDFTLDKAAARLYTNRTYLSVLVNSQFGLPFRDYINRMRIECAKDLIRNHKGTHLEDIALASGFSSGSQFSRKFKEIEGKTPNAWIRSMVQ